MEKRTAETFQLLLLVVALLAALGYLGTHA
jgi:hypothetical protein